MLNLASTTICGGITGIRAAFGSTARPLPTGTSRPVPFVLLTPFEGTINPLDHGGMVEFQGTRETEHRIKAQVCVSNQGELADAYAASLPYLQRFVATIDHWKTLNGLTGILDARVTHYKYGRIELNTGDPPYLGWELVLSVLEVEQNVVYNATGPTL